MVRRGRLVRPGAAGACTVPAGPPTYDIDFSIRRQLAHRIIRFWWETLTLALLFVRFNDGTSTQWTLAGPSAEHNTRRALRCSAIADPQRNKYKRGQNIYAAPFDALAYSGMQINGGMEVSQEYAVTMAATLVSDAENISLMTVYLRDF